MSTPALDQARTLLRQGRLPEARALLEQALAATGDAEGFVLLGLVCGMLGDAPSAETACRGALALKPDYPEAEAHLGIALAAQGKFPEAVAAYERARAFSPNNATVHNNLGVTLNALGRSAEAEACYREALALKPDYPDAWYNLGNLLAARGKAEEAVAAYERVLAFNPRHVGALINLGQHRLAAGHVDQSIETLRNALEIAPRHGGALNNLGNAYLANGEPKEAIACFEQALRLNAGDTSAWINLGLAHFGEGALDEAERCYRQALSVNPGLPELHNNLGNLFSHQERHGEAERCYREALRLKADFAEAHNNLGLALHAQGRLYEGVASYREALRLKPDYPDAWTNLLFSLNYNPAFSPEQIFAEHRRWGESFGRTREGLPPAKRAGRADNRLKVGYVSPDLRAHSVGYFIEPILRHHDRTRFEVYCYVEIPESRYDATTERLKGLDLHWFNTCGKSDLEVARRMRQDGIDILVDLAGHTANTRLLAFAYRPAPVQATYLGYPNTTGLPSMDYRLTDEWADPPGQEAFHTEQLVRLAGGFLCYAPADDAPDVAPTPAAHNGFVTFGSFNMLPKTAPEVVALWARLLQAVPDSRLILKNRSLHDPATREHYQGLFKNHGVAPERIELIGFLPARADHLALYSRIDIGLDTFPYNGTTTTCEALWMGVPVIALEGDRHAARVGVSLLSRLGLQDLIAGDETAYLDKAVRLAADLDRLTALRAGLCVRLRESGLCDGAGFTRTLEEAYRTLWAERTGRQTSV